MTALQLLTTRRRAPGLWAWLLTAMVLAQTLGFMHNIVHAPAAQHGGQTCLLHTEVHTEVHAGAQERAANAWLADLFAAHDDESDCRLYDQFSHGDCMPAVPLLCLPTQVLPDFLQMFLASSPSTPDALVQARGPPSVR